ncbi:MAG: hypothetical protein QNJ40_11370 [Xanthomonadales bacterium]|nr:hypothetical protein [Xanthomonadales bacterium]
MRTLSTVAALALLMAAVPALADFKRDYGTGLKALQDGDYQRALTELEKAIGDNPKSAARVRIYGMRFEPYLPHYYLGEARFQTGDCEGAIAAWEEAERQGVVQSQDVFADLGRNKARCATQVVDVSGIAATAREAIGQLVQSVNRLEDLSGEARLRQEWPRNPDWQATLERSRDRVGGLQSRLEGAEAGRDADAIEAVSAEAGGENDQVQTVLAAVATRLTEIERQQSQERVARERNEARTELIRATASIRTSLNADISDSSIQSIGRELEDFNRRSAALQASASAPVSQYRDLTRQINSKIREYRQAVQDFENQQRAIARRTPPEPLRRAAEAYFSGRYGDAARLADPGSFSDTRARVQAHLFRAAARYNLYVLDGESNDALLTQARNDIRSIKQLDGRFSPYIAAFSPKFVSLFENTL